MKRVALTIACVALGVRAAGAQCPVVFPSTSVDPTAVTLAAGEKYFRDNGMPSLLLGTNPVSKGRDITQFQTLFAQAAANERIVRIHISNGTRPVHYSPGALDCAWAQYWDQVFYEAEQQGLYVLPVLDVWADWDANPARASLSQSWTYNIYNADNPRCDSADPLYDPAYACGTATDPKELLVAGGSTQTTWLTWMGHRHDHRGRRRRLRPQGGRRGGSVEYQAGHRVAVRNVHLADAGR